MTTDFTTVLGDQIRPRNRLNDARLSGGVRDHVIDDDVSITC
jgi:hypothetical protein